MFGFQTLACLHDIPLVRSSTNKIQDVYVKTKDKSAFLRIPCNLAETVADKTLKIVCNVASPFVKSFHGPVRVIDDYGVKTFRQIEEKYPSINTSTEDVINKLNEKAEPVRNVVNSVRDTTTLTIQQGKETVSNVANATINKATNVADSLYTFCEKHVPGKTISVNRYDFGYRTTLLWERIKSTVSSLGDYAFQRIQFLLIWCQTLILLFLTKIKQINDCLLNKFQHKSYLFVLLQKSLIRIGSFLECIIQYIQKNDRMNTKYQQNRTVPQKQQFHSRPTLKPGALLNTSQNNCNPKIDTPSNRNRTVKQETNKDDLYSRLTTEISINQPTSSSNDDTDKLFSKAKATDNESLYSRLSPDIISNMNKQQNSTKDQKTFRTKVVDEESNLAR